MQKESRLETSTGVWKLNGNPKIQEKRTKALECASGREVKGTDGLGAKESRLGITTSVWKLEENPKVQVKGTKVLECASEWQSERNQWAGCEGKSLGNHNQCVETNRKAKCLSERNRGLGMRKRVAK